MSMKHDVYTMTKNQNYKGFTVLDCKELPEYDALGIWLKNKKTGLLLATQERASYRLRTKK